MRRVNFTGSNENRTDRVILDPRNRAAGPVATVRMPCRIHEGFHGVWVPERELAAAADGEAARRT